MTKRKGASTGRYSPLELAQYKLRKIAIDLENGGALEANELRFLVAALKRIGQGEDANVVLSVKAKRGERKTPKQTAKRDKIRFALGWIASAIRSHEDGGLGMSLDEAFASASESGVDGFGLAEDTLRTHWGNYREFRSPDFPRPIASLPDDPKRPSD
ncbi:MAG: hypothetical protein ABSA13_15600 [Beijerinckiaceae bacterium]|jgi:hypothetical protein